MQVTLINIKFILFTEHLTRQAREEVDRHTELDQHAIRLVADLSAECLLLTQAAKDTIDEHTGCTYVYLFCIHFTFLPHEIS